MTGVGDEQRRQRKPELKILESFIVAWDLESKREREREREKVSEKGI